jgi:hypothetical protein
MNLIAVMTKMNVLMILVILPPVASTFAQIVVMVIYVLMIIAILLKVATMVTLFVTMDLLLLKIYVTLFLDVPSLINLLAMIPIGVLSIIDVLKQELVYTNPLIVMMMMLVLQIPVILHTDALMS